ncbi:NAD(P)/FAD-dependent oxidoreductase [Nonomuraea guangzhouensis]|uniref:NAD(P)/FAD-dependent oxidoreductase n=1 Tax=Nonomuraea guangzhouensis TaxID=1291555 RepID=A0ABW4GRA9_9ACTN|nr:FAD-dependent oxidoreductase [Nonomuraea guangzhouensis]
MRIVVVGAGVVGLACAYELVRDGHDVVVLDRGPAGAAASHGNAAKIALAETGPVPAPGMVVQGLKWMLRADSPLYIKPSLSPGFIRFMVRMARHCTEDRFRAGLALHLRLASTADDLLDEWRAAGLEFEMHRRGVLLAYESTRLFQDRLRYQDVFSGHGEEVEVLDVDGVHRVEPALSDRVRHGLFYARDRQIEPDSLTSTLAGYVRKHGGEVRENAEVRAFDSGAAGVHGVVTADERLPCDAVVLAAGVWSGPLSRRLGNPLPIRPGKGYSLDYTPPPVTLRTSLTLEDAHVAVTPLDGMLRLAGTMEFSGIDERVNGTRIEAIKRAASTAFRDWDPAAPHRTPWAGLRPMTPDGLPIVGRLYEGGNVWVASGHGMLGLTLAPSTARMIQRLVRGEAEEDPLISPRRFQRASYRSRR